MNPKANSNHPVPERFSPQFQTGPLIARGTIVIITLVGGLLSWSVLASISGAVIGQGVVSLESNVKKIQHLDGGIVAELLVRDGDRVKAGEVLVRLDGTSHRANEAITSAQLLAFKAHRARLEAERDGLGDIAFLPAMLEMAKRAPRVAKLLAGQRRLFAARLASRHGEAQMLRERISQHMEEIKGLDAELSAKTAQLKLNRIEADAIRPLQVKRLVTKTRLRNLDRDAARLRGDAGAQAAQIARTRGSIAETELRIAQIKKAALEKIVAELREIEGQIAEGEERIVVLRDKLRHVEIRAPRAGRVHDLSIHTVGGVIEPATQIMIIVPEKDRLILKVRIAPADIDNVKLHMSADIRFSTLNTYKTLTLQGQVVSRSAAASRDEVTGASFYNVIVKIEKNELAKIAQKNVLVPDLPAEVFVQTSARSVLSYLMKPLSDQFARALREE